MLRHAALVLFNEEKQTSTKFGVLLMIHNYVVVQLEFGFSLADSSPKWRY